MHDGTRPGVSNSGIIVDDDGITVVDAQLTPERGAAFAAVVESFGLPIRRLALTSSHMPYVGGSGAFALPAVYGTAQISAHLDQPANLTSCCAMYPDDAPALLQVEDQPTRTVTHTVTEGAWLSANVVAAPLAGELDENLIVQVPQAQVVFAGAMCSFGVTPMAGMGDPARWADDLDILLGWGEIFVPGHGPIGGREQVRDLQAYLRACVAADGNPGALGDGPWSTWTAREYDAVNVERAARLAEGDREPPATFRALLGL